MHSAPGLVFSDRPEGCLLSCFDPSATQTFLRFAFEGAPRTSVPAYCCHNRCLQHRLGLYMQQAGSLGLWTGPQLLWHINCLQLWTVHLALRQFRPLLLGKHVLVRKDNTAAVSCINRLGGIRLHRMSQLARHLLLWSHTQFKSLRAVHIPGKLNRAADALSRQLKSPGEWWLHSETIRLIWSRFGEAQIDLFAAYESSHCQLYFSLNEGFLCTDSLAHSWPQALRKYAFAPVSLLAQTLCKLREDEEQVLLVAPHWPTQTWFPELISSLSVAVSRKSIAHIRGPHPELQKLWAALCLPQRSAEMEDCLQTEVGPLDSGGRRLGVPISRRAMSPGGKGSLHSECCLLLCVGAWRLSGGHLQSCGLGDTEHLRKILQSPRWASLFPRVG